MKKIIGGLLVATLLATPALLKVEFIAYEVYKSQSQIIAFAKRFDDSEELMIEPEDVDDILADIDRNNRSITRLLENKYNVYGQIQTTIGLKAATRTRMSEEQIDTYKQFSEFYEKELKTLNKALSEIDEKFEMKEVQREIIKDDTDYEAVYGELHELNERQGFVINKLGKVIDKAMQTLAVL